MKSTQYHHVEKNNTAKLSLALLTPEEFLKFWPGIEKMLDTVPHTWRHWTKEYIYNAVLSGHIQVWCIGPPPYAVCVFFTSISIHPAMRSFCVTWAGGSFDDEMVPLLEAGWMNYARANDCDEVAIYGREGWGPKLAKVGFRKDSVTWTRRVPNMRIN